MHRHPRFWLSLVVFVALVGAGAVYFGNHMLNIAQANTANKTASLAEFVGELKHHGPARHSSLEVEHMVASYLLSSDFDCVEIHDEELGWDFFWPTNCVNVLDLDGAYSFNAGEHSDLTVVVYMLRATVLGPIIFEVASYVILLFAFALVLIVFSQMRRRQLQDREDELSRNATEKLRATIYASLDAVVTMDEEGLCTDFNPAAERIFGFSRDQIVGNNLGDFIVPEEYRAAHHKGMERFRETRSSNIAGKRLELQALRENSEVFPIEMVMQVIAMDEQTSFVAFIRDVSEEKRISEEREEALVRAESAAQAKSDFVATMSHEIRTPLNGVIGILGLLRGTGLNPEQKKFVEVGRQSGEILLQLINDILDFSKLEAGKLELDTAPFQAADIVRNVTDMLRPEADRKGIALNIHSSLDSSLRVVGDAGRLQQVLINILGNAVKFTDKGHVTLTITESSGAGGNRHIRFACEDSGAGIPHEKQPNLFEKFSTGQQTSTGKIPGTGLGLAISRTLVDLMDGEIGFESTPGAGSRFWFSVPLPVVVEIQQEEKETAAIEAMIDPATLSSKRILLAEDNPTNSMIARAMLEKAGHNVDTAANGLEAVEAVKSFEYDLVFMDIGMPDMDGVEATHSIRSLPDNRGQLPIIALTAHVLEKEKDRLFDAGMDDYLAKPVTQEMLMTMLAKWSAAGQTTATSAQIMASEEHTLSATDHKEPVFDPSPLHQLLADTSPEIFPKLVASFHLSLENRIESIVAAAKVGDATALDDEVHALGSSAGTFGGQRLFALCRSIEAACAAGENERAISMASGIDDLAKLTANAVAKEAATLVD